MRYLWPVLTGTGIWGWFSRMTGFIWHRHQRVNQLVITYICYIVTQKFLGTNDHLVGGRGNTSVRQDICATWVVLLVSGVSYFKVKCTYNRRHLTQFLPFIEQNIPNVQQQQELMNEAIEKAKRAAELQAKIQAQLTNKPNLVRAVILIRYNTA